MSDPTSDPISSVAVLDEPTRRRLYEYVVRARVPVGRDEASTAVGVTRATAAFHLDRLADEGLLDAVHQRISGRTGPGAGRPAKLYLRPTQQIEVSLPQRCYELAGQVLAAAVEDAEMTGQSVRKAVAGRARDAGRQIGLAAASRDPAVALEHHGFEPRTESNSVRLGNCPFHNLAQQHTDLVCGMNLDLIRGLLEGIDSSSFEAKLNPTPGNCCVVLEPAPTPNGE